MTRLRADLLLLLTAVIWGSTFVVQKVVFLGAEDDADALGPLTFTGARFLLGALVVAPLVLWEARRAQAKLRRADLAGFLLCGAVLFAGSYTQQIGIIGTSVTNAGFLTGLYVPLAPLLGLLLLRRAPHWAVWPGAVGCTLGMWHLNGGALTGFNDGDVWVMVGAGFWALHLVCVGLFVGRSQRPLTLACVQFAIAGAIGSLAAPVFEAPNLAILADAALPIAYAGILAVGVAFTLQVVGQRVAPAADAAIILSLEMVFAALGGAAFLAERMTAQQYAGAALILVSVLAVEALPFLRRTARVPV